MVDPQWLAQAIEALACRLDRIALAAERCCLASEAVAVRPPRRALNIRTTQVATDPAAFVQLLSANPRRVIVALSREAAGEARLSPIPTVVGAGLSFDATETPLILHRDVYGEAVIGEWWIRTSIATFAQAVEWYE